MGKIPFALLLLCLLFLNCNVKEDPLMSNSVAVPTRFAVISDPHYFDPSLCATGSALNSYLSFERKLVAESDAILQSAITSLGFEKLDFVIIPGDLTKDGELLSHHKFADYLRKLKAQGKKVYVIPGNHDINNPFAVRFNGAAHEKVQSVTPEEFVSIYSEFGYGDALERDPNSLSYVAEPVQGIYLIAMDACRYKENRMYPISSGKFSSATLKWIMNKIKEAKDKNKFVIGFMHHNIAEHYAGQSMVTPNYMVNNYAFISKHLAESGMNIVFTGHSHIQDVVYKSFDNTFLYDIATGSLVTYPNPYRIVSFPDSSTVSINSVYVENRSSSATGKSFQESSKNLIASGIKNYGADYIARVFGIRKTIANIIAPYAAAAFLANAEGDELPGDETRQIFQKLNSSRNFTNFYSQFLLKSLWNDLPPSDNNLIIDLNKGNAITTSLGKSRFNSGF